MWSKTRKISFSLLVSLMALISLLAWFAATWQTGFAQSDDVFCVVPVGEATGPFAVCDQVFTSVQTAVATSVGGEEIRIAAGSYTDVHTINNHVQIAYIDKNVSLHGGYMPPFDTSPDSDTNHTILDAQRNGRVLYIAPGSVVSVTGLHITGGDATNEGLGFAEGGGIYIGFAQTALHNNHIYNNVAAWADPPIYGMGGGIFVEGSVITMTNNVVSGNITSLGKGGSGGGILIRGSQYLLAGNEILSNTAQISDTAESDIGFGGGIVVGDSNGRLSHNVIQYNVASDGEDQGWGGGLVIHEDRVNPGLSAVIEHNTIAYNTASQRQEGFGGGIYIARWAPDVPSDPWQVLLHNNHIQENVALVDGPHGFGGGLAVLREDIVFTMTNNVIISNTAVISGETGLGGGFVAGEVTVHSTNNKIMGNTAIISPTRSGIGGAVYYENSVVNHENDIFIGNQATQYGSGYGGALYQDGWSDSPIPGMRSHFVNTVLNDNQASVTGSAIMAGQGSEMNLIHATIANNQGDGAAIQLGSADNSQNTPGLGSTLHMTNTIMSGNDTGLYVGSYNEAVVNGILWHDTQTAVSLAPYAWYYPFHEMSGDPVFAADGYHIQSGSAATRQGIPSGIYKDIDGQGRPTTPTLGVDEYWLSEIWLPIVNKN